MSGTDSIPSDIDELTSLVKELRGKVTHQSLFIDQLLEQIRLARRQHFDVRSEHYSPDQLRLLNELRLWLDDHLFLVPPRSALGKAMYYLDTVG